MKILPTLLAGSALILASGAAAQTPPEPSDDTDAMTTQEPPADPVTADPAMEEPAMEAPPAEDPSMTDPATEAPTTDPAMEAPATDGTFTDAEVESFAAAVVKIQALPGDDASKQQQAAQIVAESGIDAQTFNAIGTAMQTDAELAERVRAAAAAVQPQPPE